MVKDLVSRTIDVSYTRVYSKEAILFFKKYHSEEHIQKDAKEGYLIILELKEKIIGTGTLVGNEIKRIYVDPAIQFQGFGKIIMKNLEKHAKMKGVKSINVDVSLNSKEFYDSLNYFTVKKDIIALENNENLNFYKMKKELVNSN